MTGKPGRTRPPAKEKEKGETFGEGKYLVFGGEEEQRGKRRKIYGGENVLHRKGEEQRRKGGKYLVCGGEKKGKGKSDDGQRNRQTAFPLVDSRLWGRAETK